MNIAQALKQKNRILREIGSLKGNIQKFNSVECGADRPVDVENLMLQYDLKKKELVSLKIKLFEATRPIREHIFLLSELKDELSFISCLSTDKGIVRADGYMGSRTSDIVITKEAIFDHSWVEIRTKQIQNEIDKIQDELDMFNHQTSIEIE